MTTVYFIVGLLLQARLFQYAIPSAWRNIIAWLTGNYDASWLHGMLELPVTSSCTNQLPSIPLD